MKTSDNRPRASVSRFDAEAAALTHRPATGRESLVLAIRGPVDDRKARIPRTPSRDRHAAVATGPIGKHAPSDLPCQLREPDLWFADSPADLERAKALCAGCSVRLACLAGAVEREEYTGVWGGQIFDRGRIVSHKRGRGRPRKGSVSPQTYPALRESA